MRRFDRTTLLGVAASVALVVGAYLPWIRDTPAYTGGQPLVYIFGMDAGFAALDRYLLLVAFLAFLASFLRRWEGLRALVYLAGGALATLGCATLLKGSDVGFGSGAPFTPDVGWYVASFGALVLLLVGGAHVVTGLGGVLRERAAGS